MTTTYNLMLENIIPVEAANRKAFGAITNYLDVPLMLTTMVMFCTMLWKKNLIIFTLLLFIAYEFVISIKYGLQPVSSIYLMGIGIAIVFLYSFVFFAEYIKTAIQQNRNYGKTLMISSILFAYGIYAIVYYFFYIKRTPGPAGVLIIYYLASIIFSLLMSMGIIWLKKQDSSFKKHKQTSSKRPSIYYSDRINYKV
jgi:hypothetical protein